jgi:hypothetical protein
MLNWFKGKKNEAAQHAATVSEAQDIVARAIREDENLFQSYRANISASFLEECRKCPGIRASRSNLEKISTKAATNFLNFWVKR